MGLQPIFQVTPLLPSATKLGQGYVFTRVCDSVHRRGLGLCLGGLCHGDPAYGNEQMVRILLECILVFNENSIASVIAELLQR